MLVFGMRPEAIKIAPVFRELLRHELFHVCVCVTGQHRQMLDQVLRVFNIEPDRDLDVMTANQDLTDLHLAAGAGCRRPLHRSRPVVYRSLRARASKTDRFRASRERCEAGDRSAEDCQPGRTDQGLCDRLSWPFIQGADVDDLRESPALHVVQELAAKSVGKVLVVEPHISKLPQSLEFAAVDLVESKKRSRRPTSSSDWSTTSNSSKWTASN